MLQAAEHNSMATSRPSKKAESTGGAPLPASAAKKARKACELTTSCAAQVPSTPVPVECCTHALSLSLFHSRTARVRWSAPRLGRGRNQRRSCNACGTVLTDCHAAIAHALPLEALPGCHSMPWHGMLVPACVGLRAFRPARPRAKCARMQQNARGELSRTSTAPEAGSQQQQQEERWRAMTQTKLVSWCPNHGHTPTSSRTGRALVTAPAHAGPDWPRQYIANLAHPQLRRLCRPPAGGQESRSGNDARAHPLTNRRRIF